MQKQDPQKKAFGDNKKSVYLTPNTVRKGKSRDHSKNQSSLHTLGPRKLVTGLKPQSMRAAPNTQAALEKKKTAIILTDKTSPVPETPSELHPAAIFIRPQTPAITLTCDLATPALNADLIQETYAADACFEPICNEINSDVPSEPQK